MHSSNVLSLIALIALSSTPVLSAPIVLTNPGSRVSGVPAETFTIPQTLGGHTFHVLARANETSQLAAPGNLTDESQANIFTTLFKIGTSLFSALDNKNKNQRREFAELLARAAANETSQVAAPGGVTDESQANIFTTLFKIGTSLFSALDNKNKNQRREFAELLARAQAGAVDQQSQASFLTSLLKAGGSLLSSLFSNHNSNSRREFEELLARAQAGDLDSESQASFLSGLVKVGGSLFSSLFGNHNSNSRREFEELLARAAQAGEADESQASFLSGLVKVGSSIFSSLFSSNNRRDLDEFLAHVQAGNTEGQSAALAAIAERALDDLMARADADADADADVDGGESEAFEESFIPYSRPISALDNMDTMNAVSADISAHEHKRELIELLARAAGGQSDATRFHDISKMTVFKPAASFYDGLSSRNDEGLLAREALAPTGSNIAEKTFISPALSAMLHNIVETTVMGRSLNELD